MCIRDRPGTVPPKPGLARVAEDGAEIIVELWDVPQARFGEFVAEIPPPLGIGNLEPVSYTHLPTCN